MKNSKIRLFAYTFLILIFLYSSAFADAPPNCHGYTVTMLKKGTVKHKHKDLKDLTDVLDGLKQEGYKRFFYPARSNWKKIGDSLVKGDIIIIGIMHSGIVVGKDHLIHNFTKAAPKLNISKKLNKDLLYVLMNKKRKVVKTTNNVSYLVFNESVTTTTYQSPYKDEPLTLWRKLRPTHVSITPSLVNDIKKIWKLEIQVKDDKGKLVEKGSISVTATGGNLSNNQPSVLKYDKDLTNGKYTKGWIEEPKKQHTITVKFLGDEKDPLIEDRFYQESESSIKLPPDPLEMSTVFVIDTSGSMRGSKLASAKAAVRLALAKYPGISKTEEWALYTFNGCGSCSQVQPFTQNSSDITSKLGFSASGATPIAYSLMVAANYLHRSGRGKKGRIILLSDGGENCNGNPVEAAKAIHTNILKFSGN